MSKDSKIWDRFSENYYKNPISDIGAYEHKLNKTREYLKPDMNALEIGCGTGGTAIKQAPYLKSIFATDISPQMIKIAKARPEYQDVDNVTFKAVSLDELHTEDESMDIVFALSILHLLRDPQEAIGKAHQILKPGGVFISSTVCISDIMPVFKWIAPIGYRLGVIPFINAFSSNDLERFIQNAGFSIEYKWKRANKKEGKDKAAFIIAKKKHI